jgi:hypothetical protein
MKKTQVLLGSLAVLLIAGVLLTGCDNTTDLTGSLSVNEHGVSAPKNVEIMSLVGGNLIKWDPVEGVPYYSISRKVKDAEDSTAVVIYQGANNWCYDSSPSKNTPVNNTVYVYTVKAVATSDLGTDPVTAAAEPKEAAAAKIPAPGSDISGLYGATFTAKFGPKSTDTAGDAQYASIIVTGSNLDPAFSYTIIVYYSTDYDVATPATATWAVGGSGSLSAANPTRNALYDGSGTVITPGTFTSNATTKYKVVVEYTASTSNYVVPTTAISANTADATKVLKQVNQKEIGTL